MNRANYDDSPDNSWQLIMYRGAVTSAIRGKRGQAFLRELLAALDAMPEKRLTSELLEDGPDVCALGAVGRQRGVDMSKLNPEDYTALSKVFGIPQSLVREIEWENDDDGWGFNQITPERRWERMRAWVVQNIKKEDVQ